MGVGDWFGQSSMVEKELLDYVKRKYLPGTCLFEVQLFISLFLRGGGWVRRLPLVGFSAGTLSCAGRLYFLVDQLPEMVKIYQNMGHNSTETNSSDIPC